MDLTSTLKGDAFRPFATLVAPGAIGLAPWALLAYAAMPEGREFWNAHPLATGIALFILSIAFGLVFENLGARIELGLDALITLKEEDHFEIWKRYLLLTFEHEPIGQRYLRSVLFRMKFELAFLGSLPVQTIGWFLLVRRMGLTGWGCGIVVAAVVLAVWFTLEAYSSAKILAWVRRDLVGKFGKATA